MIHPWQSIEKALNAEVTESTALIGGDIADIQLLTLADGRKVVAKRPRDRQPDTTATEAMMLQYLAKHSAPVPDVLLQEDGLLLLRYIPNQGITHTTQAAQSAARYVAELHHHLNPDKKLPYGFSVDTCIGPLAQRNTPSENWIAFFRDYRLLEMANRCLDAGRLDTRMILRIEKLAMRLGEFLPNRPEASLLHGDLWVGNILINGDRVAGFIDPAIYYGHREMDLAFMDLTGGLGSYFFEAYHHHYPIDAGFYQERCALYQFWPLLVHVHLFGGGYVQQVDALLRRFGV